MQARPATTSSQWKSHVAGRIIRRTNSITNRLNATRNITSAKSGLLIISASMMDFMVIPPYQSLHGRETNGRAFGWRPHPARHLRGDVASHRVGHVTLGQMSGYPRHHLIGVVHHRRGSRGSG